MAQPHDPPETQRAPPRSARHALWFIVVHSTQVFVPVAQTKGAGQSLSTRHCTQVFALSVVSQRGNGDAQSASAVQPAAADPGLNPHRLPALGGFVNFNILGSEEGGFLYQSIYFAKDPILSISLSGTYQSRAIRVPKGVTDQREIASTLFLDYPFSEQQELVFMLAGYGYGNGTGSRDTGIGAAVDLGFRYKFVRPYLSFEYFDSSDCPTDGSATPAQCAAVHTADSRNFRAGLDFYVNKTQNHVILEFSLPANRVLRGLYTWYFRNILPRLGQLLSRNSQQAYSYLPDSVSEFPYGER